MKKPSNDPELYFHLARVVAMTGLLLLAVWSALRGEWGESALFVILALLLRP